MLKIFITVFSNPNIKEPSLTENLGHTAYTKTTSNYQTLYLPVLLSGEPRHVALRLPHELEHLDGPEPEEVVVAYPLPSGHRLDNMATDHAVHGW